MTNRHPLFPALVGALLSAPVAVLPGQPRVTATVQQTIGVSTHADSLLQGITDIAIGADGSVIVADGIARNVKVFGANGSLRQIIGRRGAGPGEFGYLAKVEVANDGRIAVVEAGRVQFFTPAGLLDHSFKIVPIGEIPLGYAIPADRTLLIATAVPVIAATGAVDSASLMALAAGRAPPTRYLDSLIRLRSWKSETDSTSKMISTSSPPVPVQNLTPTSLWSRNKSGTMVASSSANPSFRFYSADGRLVRATTPPSSWRATPLTEADVDVLLNKYSESMTQEMRAAIPIIRRMGMSPQYPAFIAMILADDENIWVQPPVKAADIRAGRVKTYDFRANLGLSEWHVYSPAGVFRAIVAVPEGFHLKRIVGDRLYGDALNANDEPVVQVLRVTLPR